MKSLQAAATQLDDLGVKVLGVSRDSVEDQAKFAKECDLKFGLLSDADGSATSKYDCAYEGRPMSQRVTFLIDKDGKVRLRDEGVSVKTHGEDMVAAVKRIQDEG